MLRLRIILVTSLIFYPGSLEKGIFGDRRVKVADFSHHVSIESLQLAFWIFPVWHHRCGGTLIHRSWLITAADCACNNCTLRVILGTNDRTRIYLTLSLEKWINYESSPPTGHKFMSIALVKLSKAVDRTRDRIEWVSLPQADEDLQLTEARVVGFSMTKENETPRFLQLINSTIEPPEYCEEILGTRKFEKQSMTCVTSRACNLHVTTCHGDLGSGLIAKRSNTTTVLLAVVSSAICSQHSKCSIQNAPEAFVKVTHYLPWIYETIKELGDINQRLID